MDYDILRKKLQAIDNAKTDEERRERQMEAKICYHKMNTDAGYYPPPHLEHETTAFPPTKKSLSKSIPPKEVMANPEVSERVFNSSIPLHTYDNPFLHSLIDHYKAPPPLTNGCTERVGYAAALGAVSGVMFHLCHFPWFYNDPIEYTGGSKGKQIIRSQWPRFLKGFAKPIGYYSTTAVIFTGVECLSESLRGDIDTFRGGHTDHYKDTALGGFAAGLFMASLTKRFDTMILTGAFTGAFMSSLRYFGLSFASNPQLQALKVGGKLPLQHEESYKLTALKEKYPEYADL